ncbi:hypothetical protein C9374_001586 [Naegleria lovaniensis]|uniref:Uncharacterized protein n=1 Tax=Naegleria lovaniensis TaxID=51637 RepID=A0AA88GW65_NAELO|nr:uncharacterized protein C9374_001586 [Naegleria lovaniensis]KAG2387254.1 hypothetical protein C9374_001586 [Naegleria lovaniensis]
MLRYRFPLKFNHECKLMRTTFPMMNCTGNNHVAISITMMKRFTSKNMNENMNESSENNNIAKQDHLASKSNSEASQIPSSASSSFITQVYNLKNKIEVLEEKTLAYFPKTSVQLTPYFLNEMMKKPKNYYWAAFAAIVSIIAVLYVRYGLYFKQHVGKLFEQETMTQKSAIATLRVMQVYSDNFGAFPSLKNVKTDQLVDKLNCDDMNIEIKKDTLATVISLMNFEHFINRFAWNRDFLSLVAASIKTPLTKEMSQVIFEKILSSPSGKRILREECPQNVLNALDVLLTDSSDNFQEIGSKIMFNFFEGDEVKIDDYLKTFSAKSGVDISNIQNYIENLKKSKTSVTKLKLSETNIRSSDIEANLGMLPVAILSSVFYCTNSWKKRANAPAIFLSHVRWWAGLAGAIPTIADIMISILHTQQYSRKIENFYVTQDLQQQSFWKSIIDFTPTSFNIMYASIRIFEAVAVIALWKRARFIIAPLIFNELLKYNVVQYAKTDNNLKFLHENELSIGKNRTYKMSIAESRKNDSTSQEGSIEQEEDDEIED